jgi:hypothetical protein
MLSSYRVSPRYSGCIYHYFHISIMYLPIQAFNILFNVLLIYIPFIIDIASPPGSTLFSVMSRVDFHARDVLYRRREGATCVPTEFAKVANSGAACPLCSLIPWNQHCLLHLGTSAPCRKRPGSDTGQNKPCSLSTIKPASIAAVSLCLGRISSTSTRC